MIVVNEEHFLHSWFKREELAEPNRQRVIINWTYSKKCQDLWTIERINGLQKKSRETFHTLLSSAVACWTVKNCVFRLISTILQITFFGLKSDYFLTSSLVVSFAWFCNYAQAKSIICFSYLIISTVMNKINSVCFDPSVIITEVQVSGNWIDVIQGLW